MADIELVIKISKEDFEIMKHNIAVNNPLCPLSQEEMVSKVAKGIPLPKGHGRLIDISKLDNDRIESDNPVIYLIINREYTEAVSIDYLNSLPTIIEADKAESDE